MEQQHLVFEGPVDGLFRRALGGRLSAAAVEEIRKLGIDIHGKLEPAYERTVYQACMKVAVRDVFPDLPQGEGFRKLGWEFIRGYEQTLLGRPLLALMRLLGPRRVLGRMKQNFRTANNYMETRLIEHGPGDMSIWLSETSGVPTYYQGVLEAGLAVTKAKLSSVEPTLEATQGCTYRVRWEEVAPTST